MGRRKSRSRTRVGVFVGAAAAALLAFPGAASAAVNSSVTNGDLVVSSTAGDMITIESVDAGGVRQVKINGADPNTGPAASSTIDSIVVTGDAGANNINLQGVNEADFTALQSVTVNGGGGDDIINGSQFADTLEGDDGNDRIIGDDNNVPGSDDLMRGEEGDDTMVWNPGDDDDINEGGPGNDTSEVNGGGKEQFEVAPGDNNGVAFNRVQPDPSFGAPFDVDISDDTERLDLNAGGGDDIVNAAAGLEALAFALDIDGGDGNDVIDGGDGPDLLSGGNGDDTITGDDNGPNTRDDVRGDAGNDTMVWNGGDDDDLNDGGDGDDTVQVNGADAFGEEFTVKRSTALANGVRFDRLGPTPPGPFNIEISDDSERLDLNANGGDDSITTRRGVKTLKLDVEGAEGRDGIEGADAEDLLSGGNGFDLIQSRDRAADQVECGGGFDLAAVDKRDTVRDCEIVIGGKRRVRHLGGKAITVAGNTAAVRLKSVGTRVAKGRVHVLHRGKSLGSVKYKVNRKPKKFRIKLNQRGLRLLARAPKKGLRIKLRIDARDANGNGWRTSDSMRLKR